MPEHTTTEAIHHERLAEAAQAAVDGSTEDLARVMARVGQLTDLLRASSERAKQRHGSSDEAAITERFAEELDERSADIGDLFERQANVCRTFNIVFFGRTGAGKSSLLSAITRADGAAVSPGQSDFTTEVSFVDWHACRLYDTPGINGWGGTVDRGTLEARARAAVEVADLVVVCFDSQSQQFDEFAKLAAWVRTYRKPVVAVLNVRNHVWRMPPRVKVRTERENLSRHVREHAGNIRDELARIGLSWVPVVALSAKRALFARASLPFKGPDGKTLRKQREEYGPEQLEAWSAYDRFEHLLVEAISRHAVELRRGALYDQLRGVLGGLHEALGGIEEEARTAAETVERDVVVPMLRLLGYPPRHDRERRRPLVRDGRDLLAELERLRNGAFQAQVDGEFLQFVRERLTTELATLRSRSLQAAEECIVTAFDRGANLDEETVRRATFDEGAMRRAAERVLAEGAELLARRTELARRDVRLDLDILARGAKVRGASGAGWKRGSVALRVGGILAGVAGSLGALAAFNIWNPFGWAAGVASGIAGIGSAVATVLGLLGGGTRVKAERERLAARRRALAEVRRNVHGAYDAFRAGVLRHAREQATAAYGPALAPALEQAAHLRWIQRECERLRREIGRLLGELSVTTDPQRRLWETARQLEAAAFPKEASRHRLHWLGEDWITDPLGLERDTGSTDEGRTTQYDPGFFERLFEGLQHVFAQVAADLEPGVGRGWLEEALARCEGDEEALAALAELRRIAEDGRPRLHVVGDYNAGKTSFIKRLLLDAGTRPPDDLQVRADPTTDHAREYAWNDVLLVDTPGFQSSDPAHAERALEAIADASAVIHLFQPNLVLGDDRHLRAILCGDEALGLVPKQQRTFFVVNRSDELGVDPEADPKEFAELVKQKKKELSQALHARGIEVDSGSVFCMASDPFGLVGNRDDVDSSAFDPYRKWDGFGPFMKAFRRSREALLRTGVDRSILEGGAARLTRRMTQLEGVIERLGDQERSIARVRAQVLEAIEEGRRLGHRFRAELERLLEDHVAGFHDGVLSEQDPERLRVLAEQLQQWWLDEALGVELDQWAGRAAEELNAWRDRSEEAIGRRLQSPEFRAAFGQVYEEEGPGIPDVPGGGVRVGEVARSVGRGVVDGLPKSVSHGAVYRAGKALGVKFKPWGAVKLARQLNKIGGTIMAGLGVVLDIFDWVKAEKEFKRRDGARQEIARFLRESVPRVLDAVAMGDEDEPGLLRQLETTIASLDRVAALQEEERQRIAEQIEQARRRHAVCAELRQQACQHLGDPWG